LWDLGLTTEGFENVLKSDITKELASDLLSKARELNSSLLEGGLMAGNDGVCVCSLFWFCRC